MEKLKLICYSHEEPRNDTIYVLPSLDIESGGDRWDPDDNVNTEIFEPSECPGLSWIRPDQNRVVGYEEGYSESRFAPFPDH